MWSFFNPGDRILRPLACKQLKPARNQAVVFVSYRRATAFFIPRPKISLDGLTAVGRIVTLGLYVAVASHDCPYADIEGI